ERHRGVGDEPVALDLRHEAADPRPELDALGVELDRGSEGAVAAAVRVLVRGLLGVARQVAQRLAEWRARWRGLPAGRLLGAARHAALPRQSQRVLRLARGLRTGLRGWAGRG